MNTREISDGESRRMEEATVGAQEMGGGRPPPPDPARLGQPGHLQRLSGAGPPTFLPPWDSSTSPVHITRSWTSREEKAGGERSCHL